VLFISRRLILHVSASAKPLSGSTRYSTLSSFLQYINYVILLSSDLNFTGKGKGKTVLLQAWSDPEGYRKLRFPDFMTTAQDGG
jgi:hypothetical protein